MSELDQKGELAYSSIQSQPTKEGIILANFIFHSFAFFCLWSYQNQSKWPKEKGKKTTITLSIQRPNY